MNPTVHNKPARFLRRDNWALQDDPTQGLSLSDAALEELQGLQAIELSQEPTENTAISIAASVLSIRARWQFCINFL